jgi:hypothetical protein
VQLLERDHRVRGAGAEDAVDRALVVVERGEAALQLGDVVAAHAGAQHRPWRGRLARRG